MLVLSAVEGSNIQIILTLIPCYPVQTAFKYAVYFADYGNYTVLFLCQHGFAGLGTWNLVEFVALAC